MNKIVAGEGKRSAILGPEVVRPFFLIFKKIPQEVMGFVPDRPFELDVKVFTKCLQSAPAGSAPGPGGCTNEMMTRKCFSSSSLPKIVQQRPSLKEPAKLSCPPP